MKIAVAKEIDPSEPRVAVFPDTVKKFRALGAEIGAGRGMTAAGTIPAAKVFVMGVGVAGLQARRLGAVVTATDVRPIKSGLPDSEFTAVGAVSADGDWARVMRGINSIANADTPSSERRGRRPLPLR